MSINPYMTNGFSHHCHLGESTFIFRCIRSDFKFSYKFLMKILLARRIAPDVMPRSTESHLGLYCLPMSHKKLKREQKWSNTVTNIILCKYAHEHLYKTRGPMVL